MVRKIKQSVKQSVNVKVHVGDTTNKKKRKYRKKRSVASGASAVSAHYPIQPYTPVYIQSGVPYESDNPLLKAIGELNNNINKVHTEKIENPLLRTVVGTPL